MIISINYEYEEKIDWRTIPQLVVSAIDEELIIYVTGSGTGNDNTFTGLALYSGTHTGGWNKSNFKKFKGEITIKNS